MKSSTYYLYVKTKILADFQISISVPLKQWPTGKERGEDGNAKIWISREQKELFRWNKKVFFIII